MLGYGLGRPTQHEPEPPDLREVEVEEPRPALKRKRLEPETERPTMQARRPKVAWSIEEILGNDRWTPC